MTTLRSVPPVCVPASAAAVLLLLGVRLADPAAATRRAGDAAYAYADSPG